MKQTGLIVILCALLFPISLFSQQGGSIVYGPKIQVNDPDPDSTLQNHPAVVIDDSLRIFVAWQDYRNGVNADIYFATSNDTGQTFTQPNVNLSQDSLQSDEYPWNFVKGDTVIIVWQKWVSGEWKIYITVSEDGGNTFTPPDTIRGVVIVNDFGSGVNYGPQPKICLDTKSSPGNAFLYLTWADNETGSIQICLARSDDLGQNFANKVIVDVNTTNVNRHPHIAVDDSGYVYCVWARGRGGSNNDPHPLIGFNKSTDGGNTFLPADVLITDDSSQVYRGNPQVTVKPPDSTSGTRIFVVWEDSRRSGGNATPDIWFSESNDGGNTFSSNLRVNWHTDTIGRNDNYRSALDIDPTGNMAVAWHSNPDSADHYGIHMCSYNDTIGSFGSSATLYNTLTERQAGNFGNNFYAPSLKVELVDSVTNFFMVWRDLYEDPNGNIYFIRGWVVTTLSDLDIDNNALDVVNDTMDFGQAPAGPAYLKKSFRIVNTDSADNPDSLDGPSLDSLITIECPGVVLYGPGGVTIDSGFVSGLPSRLSIGQSAEPELVLFIPEGTPSGTYSGYVSIIGTDHDSGQTVDSFMVIIEGPEPEENLDSLKVFPVPFKPSLGHTKIFFEGLTAEATVKIYDVSGALVETIEESGSDGLEDGLATWDPAENASGIYFYVITNPDGELKKGKLAIIK
jgi:hypothetical protein